jgi:mRNA interferase MazF
VDYVPGRGDVLWVNFTPQSGHKQGGWRPALTMSPRSYNGRVGLALICPITSQVKGYPFEVGLLPGGSVSGVVLADQIRSVDWRAREARFDSRLAPQVVNEVLMKVQTLLA